MGVDLLPTAVGAGVFGMLVALFGLSMRAFLQVGERSDERSDVHMDRMQVEIDSLRAEITALKAEVKLWQDRFLNLMMSDHDSK
jgi:hypothetical protein